MAEIRYNVGYRKESVSQMSHVGPAMSERQKGKTTVMENEGHIENRMHLRLKYNYCIIKKNYVLLDIMSILPQKVSYLNPLLVDQTCHFLKTYFSLYMIPECIHNSDVHWLFGIFLLIYTCKWAHANRTQVDHHTE